MQIQSTYLKPNLSQNRPATSAQSEAPKQDAGLPKESVTLSDSNGKTALAALASGTMMVSSVGSAGYAGIKAAQIMPMGRGGLTSAVTGLVMGAVAGGATGAGLAALTNKLDPSDGPGDAMMSGLMTIGGAVVGGAAGVVAGFVGAESLLVAPATVGAGFVGAMVPAAVFSKVLD